MTGETCRSYSRTRAGRRCRRGGPTARGREPLDDARRVDGRPGAHGRRAGARSGDRSAGSERAPRQAARRRRRRGGGRGPAPLLPHRLVRRRARARGAGRDRRGDTGADVAHELGRPGVEARPALLRPHRRRPRRPHPRSSACDRCGRARRGRHDVDRLPAGDGSRMPASTSMRCRARGGRCCARVSTGRNAVRTSPAPFRRGWRRRSSIRAGCGAAPPANVASRSPTPVQHRLAELLGVEPGVLSAIGPRDSTARSDIRSEMAGVVEAIERRRVPGAVADDRDAAVRLVQRHPPPHRRAEGVADEAADREVVGDDELAGVGVAAPRRSARTPAPRAAVRSRAPTLSNRLRTGRSGRAARRRRPGRTGCSRRRSRQRSSPR